MLAPYKYAGYGHLLDALRQFVADSDGGSGGDGSADGTDGEGAAACPKAANGALALPYRGFGGLVD